MAGIGDQESGIKSQALPLGGFALAQCLRDQTLLEDRKDREDRRAKKEIEKR
jgi:hypothetical protein